MTQGKPSSLTSVAFNTGVIAERKRIINILQEELEESTAPMLGTKGGWRDYFIALIKEDKQ